MTDRSERRLMRCRQQFAAWVFVLALVTGCDAKKPAQVKAEEPVPKPKEERPDLVRAAEPKGPTEPPAKQKERAAKSKKALAELKELGALIGPDEAIDLDYVKDLDRAVALLPELLQVDEIRLSSNATDAHLAAVVRLPALRRLEIASSQHITDDSLARLKGLPQLRHLGLWNLDGVSPAGLAHVAGLSDLEVLRVGAIPIGEVGVKHLAALRKLTSLTLQNADLTDAALAHVARLSDLRELRLRENRRLTDAGPKALSGLTKLEKIDLGLTGIGDAGLMHLEGLTNLVVVDIGYTKVTDAGLAAFVGMRQLKELHAGGTAIRGPGLKHLAGCRELTELGFYDVPDFTGVGLGSLAECSKLQRLALHSTGITDAGLADIGRLKQLRALDLPTYGHAVAQAGDFWLDGQPKRITDAGMKHLGELTNLEWLYLSGAGITDAGLAHVRGLKKLERLHFGALPNVKGPGLEHLAELPKLTTIILPRDWSQEMVAAVKKVKPKANVYGPE